MAPPTPGSCTPPARDPRQHPGLQHSGEPCCCCPGLAVVTSGPPEVRRPPGFPLLTRYQVYFYHRSHLPQGQGRRRERSWGRGTGLAPLPLLPLGALLSSTVQTSDSAPHLVGRLAPECCLPPPGSLLASGALGSWQSPLPVTCYRGGGAGGHMRGLTVLSSWRGACANLRSGETGQCHHEPRLAAPSPGAGGLWNASLGPGGLRGSGSQAQGLSF